MASAGPTPAGKRALDAEYNLVPFIDLLTCLISFLLISAVWTQIAKIDVKPTPNISGADQPSDPVVKLTVHIRGNGYYLIKNAEIMEMPKAGEDYPVKALDDKLAALRTEFAEVTAITVMADDNVQYRQLVTVMDVCLKYQFNDISVSGA
ncbi:MAG: biopolymer transporter ExbD [Deltaproteobacteria bacterium]|nr:biopolymer transporter ExbD [Deltaproteobacteria bacterium]